MSTRIDHEHPTRCWNHISTRVHVTTRPAFDGCARAVCGAILHGAQLALGERIPPRPGDEDCRACYAALEQRRQFHHEEAIGA